MRHYPITLNTDTNTRGLSQTKNDRSFVVQRLDISMVIDKKRYVHGDHYKRYPSNRRESRYQADFLSSGAATFSTSREQQAARGLIHRSRINVHKLWTYPMPYFNLMSAINLYVAVDWQGDKEIERARSEEREEKRVEMTVEGDEKSWGRREIQSCDRRKGKNAKRRVI